MGIGTHVCRARWANDSVGSPWRIGCTVSPSPRPYTDTAPLSGCRSFPGRRPGGTGTLNVNNKDMGQAIIPSKTPHMVQGMSLQVIHIGLAILL